MLPALSCVLRSGEKAAANRCGAIRGDEAGRGNIYWQADFGQVVERTRDNANHASRAALPASTADAEDV
jgi:hypothetical protein